MGTISLILVCLCVFVVLADAYSFSVASSTVVRNGKVIRKTVREQGVGYSRAGVAINSRGDGSATVVTEDSKGRKVTTYGKDRKKKTTRRPTTNKTKTKGKKTRKPSTTGKRCRDGHTFCKSWASNGECARNPRYMLTTCALSCKRC